MAEDKKRPFTPEELEAMAEMLFARSSLILNGFARDAGTLRRSKRGTGC